MVVIISVAHLIGGSLEVCVHSLLRRVNRQLFALIKILCWLLF